MTPELTMYLIWAATLGATCGLWFGAWMRDAAWRDNARGEPRIYSAGKLYFVIRDGDVGKAKRVATWCEDTAQIRAGTEFEDDAA